MRRKPPRHAHSFIVRHTLSGINKRQAQLQIARKTVESNAFYHGINLMSAARAFCFGGIVHDAILDAIVHARARWIGGDCEDRRTHLFEVGRHARERATRPGASDKGIHVSLRLCPYFWTCVFIVCGKIGIRLELVGEKCPSTRLMAIRLPGLRTRPCLIDKVARIHNTPRTHCFHNCAQPTQQSGFFFGHIIRHNNTAAVAFGTSQRS